MKFLELKEDKKKCLYNKLIIAIVLFAMLIYFIPYMAGSVYGEARPGTVATTIYEEKLEGSDGEEYKVSGVSENIIYAKDGALTYAPLFTSDLRLRLFQVQEDNKDLHTGYCIEWGVPYKKGSTYSAMPATTDSYFSNLIYQVRNGIALATLYGCQEGISLPINGINKNDWYFATQVIIWEYQQRIRVSPTEMRGRSGMATDYFSKSLSGRPAEKCYEYILGKMEKHREVPSFASSNTHTMKYSSATKDYRVTLYDKNKISASPRFKNPDISMVREGYAYTFSSKKPLKKTTIEFQHDIPKTCTHNLIWGSMEDGQAFMTGTNDDFYYASSFVTEKDGSCKIRKTSKDNNVAGIEFEISGNGIDTMRVRTDEKGFINLVMTPGKYIIKEIPLANYVPQKEQEFIIQEGKETLVSFENIPITGDVSIQKKDVSDGKELPNCGIEILDGEKQVIFQGKTNDDGIVYFKKLDAGKYFFREFEAPPGYLIDDKPHPFEIKEDGKIIKCHITNAKENTPPEPPSQEEPSPSIPKPPQTGDRTMNTLWLGLGLCSLLVIGISLIKAKR